MVFLFEDWILYRPGVKQLAKLDADIAQSKNQAIEHLIPEEKLQDIRALIEQNSVSQHPDPEAESHASEHLERFMGILKGLNIELLSIAPKEVKQKEQFLTSSFLMELRCDYHQFRQLLDAVEKSLDLIRIDTFDLITVQKEVVVTLGVEIFLFTKE